MAATLLGQSGVVDVTFAGGETVIVVTAGFGGVTTPFSCSDGNNTYTTLVEYDEVPSGGGWYIGIFKADNAVAGTYTVAPVPNASGIARVYRYSGLASGAVQDAGFLRTNNDGSSTAAGPTLTASAQPALQFVAGIKQNANTDWGAGTGFTDLGYFGTDTNVRAMSKDLTTTGSQPSEWTATGSATFEFFFTAAVIISESGGSGPQELEPPLFTNTSTIYAPRLRKTVSPGLFTNTSTIYTPTVAAGPATVSPPLFTNTAIAYLPQVVPQGTVLQAPLFTNTSTIYAPLVTPGVLALAPPLFTNISAIYDPMVGGTQLVSPPLFENTSEFFSPTVIGGTDRVLPPLFTNTSAFFAPSITTGAVQVQAPLFTNTSATYGPLVRFAASQWVDISLPANTVWSNRRTR